MDGLHANGMSANGIENDTLNRGGAAFVGEESVTVVSSTPGARDTVRCEIVHPPGLSHVTFSKSAWAVPAVTAASATSRDNINKRNIVMPESYLMMTVMPVASATPTV